MKVRYMTFDLNRGYSVDMSVSKKKVGLTTNESGKIILIDWVSSETPRYFIETDQLDVLPNPECDDGCH